MTEKRPESSLYDSLDALLDRERVALLAGDLASLEALATDKEMLFERLADGGGQERQQIETLRGKALRNQALLDSALRGIRAVANRFATLRRIRRSLETYDESGQKTVLPSVVDSKVERRA